MLRSLGNIFKVPDLRKKIFYTLMIITIHRIGAHIPIPFVDSDAVREVLGKSSGQGGILNMIDMFSGGAFKNMTVFALGIMPYISASIILQLLQVVWPRLEKIAKEGEIGRKKINQYTRYGTVLLATIQAVGVGFFLIQSPQGNLTLIPEHPAAFIAIAVLSVTTGTCFIMWLGEKITEKGIGNGISIMITLGILASYPGAIIMSVQELRNGNMNPLMFVIVLTLFVVMTLVIVMFQQASRKIPIQHARRVVGRKMTQGQTHNLPLKINTAGVIPVIFSSAILSFPALLLGMFTTSQGGGIMGTLSNMFSMQTNFNLYNGLGLKMGGLALALKAINPYIFIYILLTGFFCYFYTAITYNPLDVAENLKKSGAFIPGRRPGKPTSDYINYVLTRITLVGAAYLCGVAVLPMMLNISYGMNYMLMDFVGGTGLIIVAGVLLDTLKQIESQLMVRHYEGFKFRRRGNY
jgi:preprotein translocase subunit SecY